jgi:hypothetical protein
VEGVFGNMTLPIATHKYQPQCSGGDPSTLVHFGFLDSVSALYGGGRVSYNFLHLTVQEFFAAYHISHLGSSGLEVFRQYGEVKQWNVVWRFVAGLTKFRWYEGHIDRSVFINEESQLSIFLCHCLFEAQTAKYLSSTLETSSTTPQGRHISS